MLSRQSKTIRICQTNSGVSGPIVAAVLFGSNSITLTSNCVVNAAKLSNRSLQKFYRSLSFRGALEKKLSVQRSSSHVLEWKRRGKIKS